MLEAYHRLSTDSSLLNARFLLETRAKAVGEDCTIKCDFLENGSDVVGSFCTLDQSADDLPLWDGTKTKIEKADCIPWHSVVPTKLSNARMSRDVVELANNRSAFTVLERVTKEEAKELKDSEALQRRLQIRDSILAKGGFDKCQLDGTALWVPLTADLFQSTNPWSSVTIAHGLAKLLHGDEANWKDPTLCLQAYGSLVGNMLRDVVSGAVAADSFRTRFFVDVVRSFVLTQNSLFTRQVLHCITTDPSSREPIVCASWEFVCAMLAWHRDMQHYIEVQGKARDEFVTAYIERRHVDLEGTPAAAADGDRLTDQERESIFRSCFVQERGRLLRKLRKGRRVRIAPSMLSDVERRARAHAEAEVVKQEKKRKRDAVMRERAQRGKEDDSAAEASVQLEGAKKLEQKDNDEVINEEVTRMFSHDFHEQDIEVKTDPDQLELGSLVPWEVMEQQAQKRYGSMGKARRLMQILRGVGGCLDSFLHSAATEEVMRSVHTVMFGQEDDEDKLE